MVAKFIRLAHKKAIQLHFGAESCAICSSRFQAASPETFGYTLVQTRGNKTSLNSKDSQSNVSSRTL